MIDTVEPEIKKRAVRRHHTKRMKDRANRMFSWWGFTDGEMARVDRCYNNITRCSCYICGNRRKYDGITLQERKVQWSEKTYWQEDISGDWWFYLLDDEECSRKD